MATTLLSAGVTYAMTQNVVYALPTRKVQVQCNVALDMSLDGTNFTSVTSVTTGYTSAYPFVRCTGTTGIISLKRD